MRRNHIFGFLGLSLLFASAVALGQKQKPIETFTAFAASLGTGRSGAIDTARAKASSCRQPG